MDSQASSRRQVVVLVHGLGRTSRSFSRLHRHLEAAGYSVIDWGYASLSQSIEESGGQLGRELSRLDRELGVERIHVVGHSLGAILPLQALSIEVPAKMGRIVMLAPPVRGSSAARVLAPWLGGWIRPLRELSDDPSSLVHRLVVPPGIEIGVIAAERDGKVRVEDTHLEGEADHLVVPGHHTFIMDRPEVLEATERFLRTGRFSQLAGEGN